MNESTLKKPPGHHLSEPRPPMESASPQEPGASAQAVRSEDDAGASNRLKAELQTPIPATVERPAREDSTRGRRRRRRRRGGRSRSSAEPSRERASQDRHDRVAKISAVALAVVSGPHFWAGLERAPEIFSQYAQDGPSLISLVALAGMLWGLRKNKNHQGSKTS